MSLSEKPNKTSAGYNSLLAMGLLLAAQLANAQAAVPVGSKSYASGIPAMDQFAGGYYSMTPR